MMKKHMIAIKMGIFSNILNTTHVAKAFKKWKAGKDLLNQDFS
jgi:hypothetical protein